MMMGARAHARWEIETAATILNDRKRLFILGLLTIPILLGGVVLAGDAGGVLPEILGGKKSLQPGFLYQYDISGLHPDRAGCRPDYRLHRCRGRSLSSHRR